MLGTENNKVEAFFLEGGVDNLFAVFYPPTTQKTTIIYTPPFAEEANRCRHLAGQQARAFAEKGYGCLLIDPYGTGDSAGELEDASWELWKQDILATIDWLEARTNGGDVVLWGMRLGALLAADLVNDNHERFKQLLLWQPVLDGKTYLTQFLRQRVVSLSERNEPPETTKEMIIQLEQGDSVEVAGYTIPGGLASAIKNKSFKQFTQFDDIIVSWLEAEMTPGSGLSLSSQRTIDCLIKSGCEVRSTIVDVPPIWTLQKRTDAPGFIESTMKLMSN